MNPVIVDLVLGTLLLRPYVFGFLAAFLAAGAADIGWRRTLLFGAWVAPVAWLAEFSSTRIGIPFGLYHYTGTTWGQELFLADVPFMDCLSFTFLAYASFCLARAALRRASPPGPVVALVAGILMMLLDIVIDPIAVRGDRWFLGRIFYYPDGGVYFGVPVSNFIGWMIVGTVGVGGYLRWSAWRRWIEWRKPASTRGWPAIEGGGSDTLGLTAGVDSRRFDGYGRRVWPGIALYYAVLVFNLVVTGWIGELVLLAIGIAWHAVVGLFLSNLALRPTTRVGLEKQRA